MNEWPVEDVTFVSLYVTKLFYLLKYQSSSYHHRRRIPSCDDVLQDVELSNVDMFLSGIPFLRCGLVAKFLAGDLSEQSPSLRRTTYLCAHRSKLDKGESLDK
jgi:hypothetical protein